MQPLSSEVGEGSSDFWQIFKVSNVQISKNLMTIFNQPCSVMEEAVKDLEDDGVGYGNGGDSEIESYPESVDEIRPLDLDGFAGPGEAKIEAAADGPLLKVLGPRKDIESSFEDGPLQPIVGSGLQWDEGVQLSSDGLGEQSIFQPVLPLTAQVEDTLQSEVER